MKRLNDSSDVPEARLGILAKTYTSSSCGGMGTPGCVNKRAGGKRFCGGFRSKHAYVLLLGMVVQPCSARVSISPTEHWANLPSTSFPTIGCISSLRARLGHACPRKYPHIMTELTIILSSSVPDALKLSGCEVQQWWRWYLCLSRYRQFSPLDTARSPMRQKKKMDVSQEVSTVHRPRTRFSHAQFVSVLVPACCHSCTGTRVAQESRSTLLVS